jgi:hypothetical protein
MGGRPKFATATLCWRPELATTTTTFCRRPELSTTATTLAWWHELPTTTTTVVWRPELPTTAQAWRTKLPASAFVALADDNTGWPRACRANTKEIKAGPNKTTV